MRLPAVVALAGILCGTPALAQEPPQARPFVAVTGLGEATASPDTFFVNGLISGRGDDQVTALQALATSQRSVMGGLSDLAGLTQAVVTTDEIKVDSILDPACNGETRRSGHCTVLGYMASMTITLVGSPAERAGDAVSLAGELGASEAEVTAVILNDERPLREAATRAAFADARRQADLLAVAGGFRIVRIVRVQTPDSTPNLPDGLADIVVLRNTRPSVSLTSSAPEAKVSARVTVTFEIE